MSDFYDDLLGAIARSRPAPQVDARALQEAVYRHAVARQEVPVAPVYRPVAKAVIEDVSLKHGLDRRDLVGPRRFKELVVARNEAAYRLRQETSLSLPQIGRLLGGRNHATIIHGIARHAATLSQEAP